MSLTINLLPWRDRRRKKRRRTIILSIFLFTVISAISLIFTKQKSPPPMEHSVKKTVVAKSPHLIGIVQEDHFFWEVSRLASGKLQWISIKKEKE